MAEAMFGTSRKSLGDKEEELLAKLGEAWRDAPALRFGQLLECILDCPKEQCIWQWDTEEILPKLDKFLALKTGTEAWKRGTNNED